MTARNQNFIHEDVPVHVMAYVGEELQFHSFFSLAVHGRQLFISANANSWRKLHKEVNVS
jgi:hypothetical protein